MHQLPDTIRILDGGWLVASHPILEGRLQYRVDPDHRQGAAARAVVDVVPRVQALHKHLIQAAHTPAAARRAGAPSNSFRYRSRSP